MGQDWGFSELKGKAPTEWECPRDIKGTVEQLLKEIKTSDIPDDYEPYGTYRQTLAEIRHCYTNYETLVYGPAPCSMLWADGELECTFFDWATQAEAEGYCGQCYHEEWAHDTLKWATRDAAKAIYDDWLSRREERSN
jgi:hypothetical protein